MVTRSLSKLRYRHSVQSTVANSSPIPLRRLLAHRVCRRARWWTRQIGMWRAPRTSSLIWLDTTNSLAASDRERGFAAISGLVRKKGRTSRLSAIRRFSTRNLSRLEPGRSRRGSGRRVPLLGFCQPRRPGSGPFFLHARVFGQVSRRRRIRFERACPLRDLWPG